MRRLFSSLSALALIAGFGCNHTAGVCDCDPCNMGCCCSCAGMGYHSASGASFVPQGGQMNLSALTTSSTEGKSSEGLPEPKKSGEAEPVEPKKEGGAVEPKKEGEPTEPKKDKGGESSLRPMMLPRM